MNLLELQNKKVPELREIAKSNNIFLAKRWLKPKIVEVIYNFFELKTVPVPPEKDYSDFRDDGNKVTLSEPQNELDEVAESESKRGGVREGAGRPEGSTVKAMRLKRALAVDVPDVNIKHGVRKISGWGKSAKVAADEVVHKASLYYTKAAEYFGLMEWLKDTPLFIFVGLVNYTIKLINHMRGKKNDEETAESDTDIRSEGDGKEQSSKELGTTV